MATNAVKLAPNDLIEFSSSCHVCDITGPIDPSIKGIHISVIHGHLHLSNIDECLTKGETVEWYSKDELEWSVDFKHLPVDHQTFNASQCGFKVVGLPAGEYRYKAHVKGIAHGAEGVISVLVGEIP